MARDVVSIAASLFIALLIEAVVGWPGRLHRAIGHPVTWIGRLITVLDTRFNRDAAAERARRLAGTIVALVVIVLAALAGLVATWLLPAGLGGVVLGGLVAWPLVATRSMYDHVAAVGQPLVNGDIARARAAVSMIVGRDPNQLDAAGVSRAALESLAENASDGIVAPVFWGLVLGLPGMAAYKAINTLDSMIGHRTPRHHAFGWAAARIDDVANIVPARLTGVLFVVVSGRLRAAGTCMWRDAGQHRSPNAGWPEAAMAGALGVRLSGPRVYDTGVAAEPWLNAEGREAEASDIGRGLALFVRAMVVLAGCLVLLAAI